MNQINEQELEQPLHEENIENNLNNQNNQNNQVKKTKCIKFR